MMLTGLIKHTAKGEVYKIEMNEHTLNILLKALKCAFDMGDFEIACEMCDLERALEKIAKGESNGTE